MKNGKKVIALSAIAILMLGSSAYAGKIITDANLDTMEVVENTQFGFGGWNYTNVDVRIVDVSDFSGSIGDFNTSDGTYSVGIAEESMGADTSFESDIKNADGIVMGHLHGKDWPVGEPSGIKVINGDEKTSHGKPENCIMTSSYQAYQEDDVETSGSGYLDAFADGLIPKPVICSSPWQTHKRYKINLLPSTVKDIALGTYGNPVDIMFNLDPDDTTTGITRYQLLQKANNYTGMRLDGYKVEVLDENGTVNDALTLSLGIGEGIDSETLLPDGSDIWSEKDMATMSHGLWGAYEEERFDNGFFDYETAYYPVVLSDNNHTISYVGDMLGGVNPDGNYQELFGNWIPSIWEPMGIFHDDDQNPETDGALKAFLGVAPGYTERAWYKSVITFDPDIQNDVPEYKWLPATDADLAEWEGEWYEQGPVEDVLNLGLNYIINIGANAEIGATFTLRITPHVAEDQTPPSSYRTVKDDFNGDAVADILALNPDGSTIIWYMEKDGTHTAMTIGTVSETWALEGAGDFNNDGITDILWRNASEGGTTIIWYMEKDGTHTDILIGKVSDAWNISGTEDYNNDGIADILWRKAIDGRIIIWYMTSDGTPHESLDVGKVSAAWDMEATADYNADGVADILWRKVADGRIVIWYMNSDGTHTGPTIGKVSSAWDIEATADYDGNGIADILWRQPSDGRVVIWYMNSDDTHTNPTIGTQLTDWEVVETADYNGDGIADILWKNDSAGSLVIWYMNSDGTYTSFDIISSD